MQNEMEFWRDLLEALLNRCGFKFRELACPDCPDRMCTGLYRIHAKPDKGRGYSVDVRIRHEDAAVIHVEHPDGNFLIPLDIADPDALNEEHMEKLQKIIRDGIYNQ